MMVPYTFSPTGWVIANGQLLPIIQYQALFTIIGTTYGGDGVTTFALPKSPQPAWVNPTAKHPSYFLRCIAMQGVFPSQN